MNTFELRDKLYGFIKPTYPDIVIEVIDDPVTNVRQLHFTESKFVDLFPKQRYHFLIHLIPDDFYAKYLADTEWYELAPGELPDDLDYHDRETIASISDQMLDFLIMKVGFVEHLDKSFADGGKKCFGDFRYSKAILQQLGFPKHAQFDIFHVLMDKGGYCDCEILLNVFPNSIYAREHWQRRASNGSQHGIENNGFH